MTNKEMEFLLEERIRVISDEIQIYSKIIGNSKNLLLIHSIAYILINSVLFVVNFFFYPEEYQFWPWVILGWGIFYYFHLYLYLMNGIKSFFNVHLYFYIYMNIFFVFIDFYSDLVLNWFLYPILGWFVLLVVHKLFFSEKIDKELKGVVYALLIADNSSRTLVEVVQKKEILLKKVDIPEERIELIPMFVNALISFSENLQLEGAKINVADPNLKILTIQYRDLTLTGFVSPHMSPTLAYMKFNKILRNFYQEKEKEIQAFLSTGNDKGFSSYKETIRKQMYQEI